MNKRYRIFFVLHNEAKTKIDLGVTLGKYKVDGIGWSRAYQLVNRDNNNELPHGHVEFVQQ